MMTWTIWCSFNQSKIDGRSFWEAFLEWRTICTWSFLSLQLSFAFCIDLFSFLMLMRTQQWAVTKERLICDVCGNVVGANICNSSILIYITERSDDDNIYIMMKCMSVCHNKLSLFRSMRLFVCSWRFSSLFPHFFYLCIMMKCTSFCHSWAGPHVRHEKRALRLDDPLKTRPAMA